MTSSIGDALRARFTLQTKDIAKTPQGRFNALVRSETPKGGRPDTARIAERLGVSRRQVQRLISGTAKIAKSKPETLARLESEVRKDHQPRIFDRARKDAHTSGLVVETRAKFGFETNEAGSTDDPRWRRLTEGVPEHLLDDVFAALREGDEDRLRELVAEGLAEEYFRTPGGGAEGLDVSLSDIDYIEFWTP